MRRSDNGTEFCNSDFKTYFKAQGIIHETSMNYCPEQNGVSERKNRTIVEKARALRLDAGLPMCYWGEAVLTAIYL